MQRIKFSKLLIFGAKIFKFPAILMKTVMRNKNFLFENLLNFSILYNVMFFFLFFRSLNFFFPQIIFILGRKFVF